MTHKPIRSMALLALLVFSTVAAFATPPIEVQSLGSDLAWSTPFDYSEAHVVVSGPDGYHAEHAITGGDTLAVALGDLSEGRYTWEIVASSSRIPNLAERLSAARGDHRLTADLKADADFESHTFRGSFQVINGQIVTPDSSHATGGSDAGGANKDQVIADDLIVGGGACIGGDCADGEDLEVDTLRLRDNNLRLHFDDTSASGSYPSNDWRIEINDSAEGGDNYFAIEDATSGETPFKIEAGAPTDALRVSANGKLGIGTNNPSGDVHVRSGDTPRYRFHQDDSGGYPAHVFDIGANEYNFFISDITSDTTGSGGNLFFRARAGAPEDSIFISEDGKLGFGHPGPDSALHVERTDDASLHLENTTDTVGTRQMFKLSNMGQMVLRFSDFTSNGSVSGTANDRWDMKVSADKVKLTKLGTGRAELELDGSGNLKIQGALTTGSNITFPDYVFKDDYPLMPLDQVRAFIDKNGHLPGVRSEAEVEAAGGINLTELNVKLLEKVEELILYTLEQDTAIAELRAELEAVKAAD